MTPDLITDTWTAQTHAHASQKYQEKSLGIYSCIKGAFQPNQCLPYISVMCSIIHEALRTNFRYEDLFFFFLL